MAAHKSCSHTHTQNAILKTLQNGGKKASKSFFLKKKYIYFLVCGGGGGVEHTKSFYAGSVWMVASDRVASHSELMTPYRGSGPVKSDFKSMWINIVPLPIPVDAPQGCSRHGPSHNFPPENL